MATTANNFNLVLATTGDTVDVVAHVANNFSTLDSVIGIAHTGTGQFKSNLSMTSVVLTNPVFIGTVTGGNISATTGTFQTITATGGAITADSLWVGTYSYPATIGGSGQILTISGTGATWLTNAGGTGAATNLGNLASVAIATNLNNFTASQVTLDHILATSGTLSGLASIVATTGTFSANLTVAGTLGAAAVNATGGSITAGSFAIGTYAYPASIGSTGQLLTVTTGNAVWLDPGDQGEGSVIFQYQGQSTAPYEIVSASQSDVSTTAGSTVTYRYLRSSATSSASHTVLVGKFVKVSGINTLVAHVLTWQTGSADNAAIVSMTVNTVSAAVTGTLSASSPAWTSFVLDVSTLSDGTTYDVDVKMAKAGAGPSERAAFLGNMMVFGTT